MRRYCPESAFGLWEILQKAWKNLEQVTLDEVIRRIPKICKAAIKQSGGHFDEGKV